METQITNEIFRFYDLNGKLSLDTSPSDKLEFTLYAGKDKVRVPIADDSYFGLQYGNRTISGKWRHLFGQRAYSDYAITSSRYFNFPTMVIGGTGTDRSNRIDEVAIHGDVHYFAASGHKLEAGFSTRYLTLDYTKSFNGFAAYLAHLPTSYNMGYIQDRWRFHDAWELNGGLRFTSFSNGHYLRLSPRFSMDYAPAKHLRIQAAYGRYYQFMSLNTNEAFTGFDLWLMSAQGVPPAWGDQYVLGFKSMLNHGVHLGLELYYRSMRDLFELDPFIPDITGLEYDQLFRTGTGYAWGAELTLEKSYGSLNGELSYTLGISRRRFPGYNKDRFYPPRYDRLHDLKASFKLKINSEWSFNAVFNYSTGQPYTQPVGHTFVTGLPFTNESQNVLTIQKINDSRLPDYQRLDLGISRSGSFMGMIPATLKMQIINVYSYRNVWFYQYNFGGNSTRREKVTMLPAFPALSYTLNF